MIRNMDYRTITREQFLFNEMRIVAKLLCEGKDDKEFIDDILKLLTNKKLYKEMSTNAKNSTYKYSKEVFASDILKAYHKAIEKKNS